MLKLKNCKIVFLTKWTRRYENLRLSLEPWTLFRTKFGPAGRPMGPARPVGRSKPSKIGHLYGYVSLYITVCTGQGEI